MNINKNYGNLAESYLFSTISKKVAEFCKSHPGANVIRMGIGDVTLPLAPKVVEALKTAADEMGSQSTFKGYGPEQGYDFVKTAISEYYSKRNVRLEKDEIFISDGAKSDLGNILDLFDKDNTVLISDPVYPVYFDTNVMGGRRVIFADATEENGFLPMPNPAIKADIIYICSPNNPTGAVYSKSQLKEWVDYANKNNAIILFDAAYECFIKSEDLPGSIFEIEGARTCAIEFCSLSKTAGFTGTRAGYTIVPNSLERQGFSLNKMWLRRQTTKFNGVAYIIQRAAEAVFSKEGMAQTRKNIEYYAENAKIISDTLDELGIKYTGGKHSPYIWLKCPNGMKSWEFFDFLLEKIAVVGTPGVGFGKNGEGYFRLTSFGDREKTIEAMGRLKNLLTLV